MVHAAINPLRCYVETQYLYNLDTTYAGTYTKATAFALSSYPGDTLTMQVVLDNGSLFSYLPFHALASKIGVEERLDLSDLVYRNCPAAQIEVTSFPYLEGRIDAFFKNKNLWMQGEYVTTIDWTTANEQFHMVALENGQYAALPNHKLKFKSGVRSFEKYQKMRGTWRV